MIVLKEIEVDVATPRGKVGVRAFVSDCCSDICVTELSIDHKYTVTKVSTGYKFPTIHSSKESAVMNMLLIIYVARLLKIDMSCDGSELVSKIRNSLSESIYSCVEKDSFYVKDFIYGREDGFKENMLVDRYYEYLQNMH